MRASSKLRQQRPCAHWRPRQRVAKTGVWTWSAKIRSELKCPSRGDAKCDGLKFYESARFASGSLDSQLGDSDSDEV